MVTRATGLFYILFSLVGWRAGYTNNPTFAKLFMIGFPATFMIDVCQSFFSPVDETASHMVLGALMTMYFFKVLVLKILSISVVSMPTLIDRCSLRGRRIILVPFRRRNLGMALGALVRRCTYVGEIDACARAGVVASTPRREAAS